MSGATLSQERFLLECARQERLEREAWAAFKGDITTWPKQMIEALAAARREGAQEMRGRAAREARYWTASQKVADRILALPLTTEEP